MAQANTELKPDICVIGAGAGGLAAAAAAAAMGVPVVLIEKGRMGGESLYGGSVPSKALLAAAERAYAVREAARFGVRNARWSIDFAAVNAHVRRTIAAVALQQSRERFTGLGVRVIAGAARFSNASTVAVGEFAIMARRFIIATGSSPRIPDIPGLAEAPYLTAQTIFDLTDCPRHLIVIGAGRAGLELAQAFRRLGSEITVLEAATPLHREDRECANVVVNGLIREGIRVRSAVRIAEVRRVLGRVQVSIAEPQGANSSTEEVVEGTHLLVATGRRPNIEDLDLDAAGVRYEAHGITIDKHLRTSNKRIYAIGDVIGGRKSTHLANHHAGLIVRNALSRHPVRVDDRAVPRVIYTHPELAQVGLLEDEGRARARAIRVLRWPYQENDRAATTGATEGHVKVITNRRGDILGATIVGAAASESIAAWALAIGQRLNIGAFAALLAPYPSYADVGKRAAITYFMRGLTSTRVRRIIGWLRRLG